jgi:DNA repair exonuclease SbcCD ATPase subunit
MKFLSLSGIGLFSFASFAVDLNNKGLVLVTGRSLDEGSSNGSGKSSLINKSLLWTLFGQTAEGLKSDEVLNRRLEATDGSATLVFRIGKVTYRIERTRTRKGVTKLDFFQNGKSISTRDVRSTQEMINRTIGRDINSFIQTDFFGQGNSFPFMKLSPSGQKEVLERILPFEHLNEWLANTKLAKREVATVKLAAEIEVNKALAAQGALQAQRSSIERQHAAWEFQKANTTKKLTNEVNILRLSPEKVEIETIKKQLTKITTEWDMGSFDKRIMNTLQENAKLSTKIATHKAESHIANTELYTLRTMVDDSTCPTCKQAVIIPEAEKSHNQARMLRLLFEKESLENSIDVCITIMELNTANINEWKKVKATYDKMVSRLVELGEEESTSKIKQIEEQLCAIVASTNPYVQTLVDIDSTIAAHKFAVSAFQAKVMIIIEEEESVLLWEKAYSKDLRLLLYDRVCPFLSERANHHLQALNNAQITVNFSTVAQLKDSSTKEEFSATALSSTGGGSYSLLSGGEQQMVDFSVGLALADLAATQVKSRSNLLILDEPFVGLDDRNSESVISYLKEELAKIKSTIFLVSNEETLKGLIPNRVHVEKTNGISQIVA